MFVINTSLSSCLPLSWRDLFFLILGHGWSVNLSALVLFPGCHALQPWAATSARQLFLWFPFAKQNRLTFGSPSLLYACCSWLPASWQVAVSVLLGKRSLKALLDSTDVCSAREQMILPWPPTSCHDTQIDPFFTNIYGAMKIIKPAS